MISLSSAILGSAHHYNYILITLLVLHCLVCTLQLARCSLKDQRKWYHSSIGNKCYKSGGSGWSVWIDRGCDVADKDKWIEPVLWRHRPKEYLVQPFLGLPEVEYILECILNVLIKYWALGNPQLNQGIFRRKRSDHIIHMTLPCRTTRTHSPT